MKIHLSVILLISGLVFLAVSCGSPPKDDYNDLSFNLIDHNRNPVTFPDDFRGSPVVMGFIYTNCPDICSFITANLYKIWQEMDRPDDIRFVLVSFDPERDTPDVLNDYAAAFNMNQPPFRFLTGKKEEVERMMSRVGVRSRISYTKEMDDGEDLYFLNHTDKILLIDQNAHLVMDYGGSMTPVNIIIEDLNRL